MPCRRPPPKSWPLQAYLVTAAARSSSDDDPPSAVCGSVALIETLKKEEQKVSDPDEPATWTNRRRFDRLDSILYRHARSVVSPSEVGRAGLEILTPCFSCRVCQLHAAHGVPAWQWLARGSLAGSGACVLPVRVTLRWVRGSAGRGTRAGAIGT